MAELSESNSWKSLPMRIIAATDGASLGDIDTACILPTSSSCGTDTFSTTISAIQPRMIGTASRRIHLAMPLLCALLGADDGVDRRGTHQVVIRSTHQLGTSAGLLPAAS